MTDGTPDIFTIGPLPNIHLGFVQIPTYYAVISLATCLGIYWFYRRCDQAQLPIKQAMDLTLVTLVSGFVGARLFHVLFEHPDFYSNNPGEIFSIWQGGFVFFGGVLLSYPVALIYLRWQQLSLGQWHDSAAPPIALGYALGRISCFLVGCCYGKVCDLPWAMPLKQVSVNNDQWQELLRHPTALYASGLEFLIIGILLIFEKRKTWPGQIFVIWIGLHGINRLIMENFRADHRGQEILGLSVSSVISIVLMLAAFCVYIYRSKKSPLLF